MEESTSFPSRCKHSTDDQFFEVKRPWSKIKDQILGAYLKPYLAKVKQLGKPIVLIDGFAGKGRFRDGSDGSPLIMCKVADQMLGGRYPPSL